MTYIPSPLLKLTPILPKLIFTSFIPLSIVLVRTLSYDKCWRSFYLFEVYLVFSYETAAVWKIISKNSYFSSMTLAWLAPIFRKWSYEGKFVPCPSTSFLYLCLLSWFISPHLTHLSLLFSRYMQPLSVFLHQTHIRYSESLTQFNRYPVRTWSSMFGTYIPCPSYSSRTSNYAISYAMTR